jgi:hypothetical protein
MKLCIEGDIYFIPKFHILETGTVKLSIEIGLIETEYLDLALLRGCSWRRRRRGRRPDVVASSLARLLPSARRGPGRLPAFGWRSDGRPAGTFTHAAEAVGTASDRAAFRLVGHSTGS